MHALFRLQIQLLTLASSVADGVAGRLRPVEDDERGQATAEYALVLLAAVAIAGLLIAWAKKTKLLDNIMEAVFESILDRG